MMHAFVRALVAQVRAQDSYGVWEDRSDADLLEAFVLDAERKKDIPIIGDPDPDTLDRVSQFYSAVSLTIEQRTGLMAAPVMQMTPEGFGRMVLTCGRLVVINRVLRDIHRFGFASLGALDKAGEALVADAISWIERYPAVAQL